MPNQLDSSDIKALLRIISTHQKGMGGGDPTSGQSAQLSKPTAPNAFMQWLQQAGNTVGNAIGVNKQFDPNALTEATGPNPGDVLVSDLAKGDFKGFGQHATELFGVSPRNFKEDPLNAILSVGMLAIGAEGMKKGEIKPEEIGAKTAEQIKAEKAAGVAPKINSAQNTAIESSGILDAQGNPIPSTRSQYATGQATGKINPGAENIGGQPPPPRTPYAPYPDVSEKPAVVTDRTGKHPVTGGNPVQVDLSGEAKKNSYYLSDQQKSQAVLDKYVPGNNASEVEQALPLQLKEESQRIQNIIAQKPQSVSTSDIINDNASLMAKKGFTPGNNVKADEATTGLQKELYSQLTAGKSNIVPPNMTGEDLRQQISIMDSRLQSVYKKMDNNTTLTPSDTAALTYRQTLSNRLKSMYPSAGEALDRQSAMINAIPSVAKAAQAEKAAAYAKATAPGPDNPLISFLKGAGKGVGVSPFDPLRMLETTGLGLVGKYVLDNTLFKHAAPQTMNTPAGNVTLPGISQIKTSSGNPLILTTGDHNEQIAQINKQEAELAFNKTLGIPSAVAEYEKLEQQRNTIDTQFQTTQKIAEKYNDTVKQIQGLNKLPSLIQKAPPEWFQALNTPLYSVSGLQMLFTPGFSEWQQQVKAIEKESGIDLSFIANAPSSKAALDAIKGQTGQVIANLKQTVETNGGIWPEEKQMTGKDLINASVNAVHKSLTGNSMLDSIITPTPTQAPEPTPDDFQKLLQYKFQ